MKLNKYEAPTTEVLEVSMKRVLCTSPLLIMLVDQPVAPSTDQAGFGDTWTWE